MSLRKHAATPMRSMGIEAIYRQVISMLGADRRTADPYKRGAAQFAAYVEGRSMRWVMRSKIHNATVTEANLSYVGSITIDASLIERVGLWPGERVLVVSNTSGARLETYVIEGERGTGDICVNGAAAHLIGTGEEVIIMGFELTAEPIKSQVILVDRQNRFVRDLAEKPSMPVDALA